MTKDHLLLIHQMEMARMSAAESDALMRREFGHRDLESLSGEQCVYLARKLASGWRMEMDSRLRQRGKVRKR